MISARFSNGRLSLVVPGRDEFGESRNTEHMLTASELMTVKASIDSALLEYEQFHNGDVDAP
jgi:hypothetical protein